MENCFVLLLYLELLLFIFPQKSSFSNDIYCVRSARQPKRCRALYIKSITFRDYKSTSRYREKTLKHDKREKKTQGILGCWNTATLQ